MFFVNLLNKSGWSSVAGVSPRNLFAVPESENEVNIDANQLDVGIQDMNLIEPIDNVTNWRRPDTEGSIGAASFIEKVRQEAIPELDDIDGVVDDEDDTYIEDGVVAPVDVENLDQDDFFV